MFGLLSGQKKRIEEARTSLARGWLVAVLGDSPTTTDVAAYLAKRSVEPEGWWPEAKLGNYWCLRYVAVNYLLGTARPPDLEKSYFWLHCGTLCADSIWVGSKSNNRQSRQACQRENELWTPWQDRMRSELAKASFTRWNKRSAAAQDWYRGLLGHIRRNHLPDPHERTALWRTTALTEEVIDRYAAYVPSL